MNEIKNPADSGASLSNVELGVTVRRKIFVCVHCAGIYADSPVSQCDCMEGTGADFIEGVAEYVTPNS